MFGRVAAAVLCDVSFEQPCDVLRKITVFFLGETPQAFFVCLRDEAANLFQAVDLIPVFFSLILGTHGSIEQIYFRCWNSFQVNNVT